MRRQVAFLTAALALLLLGAWSPERSPVLPPSVQPHFQRVMQTVNQKHALGADARITDISIEKQRVRIQLELGGQKLAVALVHRGASPGNVRSRYFAFDYDAGAWSGHRQQLARLATLIDEQFAATPWFIPGANIRAFNAPWLLTPLELSRRLSMTLFAASWLVGLLGSALLLWRRPQG